ncbi:MAG: transhydrogenase subunit alpha [Leifsonia sp.]|jgi:NAD(P) transhydrogenase subunit alpha|nr:transhydrogenase subunit alpha [Leifsonia sp.]
MVGVVAETAHAEHRVALDPEAVARLVKTGKAVLIESGAGAAASFPDESYLAAGARLAARAEVIARSDVLGVVGSPSDDIVEGLHPSQLLIGLLDPLNNLPLIQVLASKRVTAAAFELLPRTLSRAQSMDALSSQASAAGYRAAIVAAESFGRYLPMMITASGTARPASVIVIGAGVAGLQAIATAKRLGAVVTGYDVRPASRGEVESLGAQFQTSSIAEGAAAGGYARALTADEQAQQQQELADKLTAFDIIITTAKVPGHTPPLLVSEATIAALKPGSVCIDLAASELGGNIQGSINGKRITTLGGVIIVGGGNLASDLPASSSQMYARNISALLDSFLVDGVITIDTADEIQKSVLICHDGQIINAALRTALHLETAAPDAQVAPYEPDASIPPNQKVQPA